MTGGGQRGLEGLASPCFRLTIVTRTMVVIAMDYLR